MAKKKLDTPTKSQKIETRVNEGEKAEMRRRAAKQDYSRREFSAWVRDTLLGKISNDVE